MDRSDWMSDAGYASHKRALSLRPVADASCVLSIRRQALLSLIGVVVLGGVIALAFGACVAVGVAVQWLEQWISGGQSTSGYQYLSAPLQAAYIGGWTLIALVMAGVSALMVCVWLFGGLVCVGQVVVVNGRRWISKVRSAERNGDQEA